MFKYHGLNSDDVSLTFLVAMRCSLIFCSVAAFRAPHVPLLETRAGNSFIAGCDLQVHEAKKSTCYRGKFQP